MTATVVVDIVGKDNFSSTLGNFGNIMTGIKSAIDLVGDGMRAFAGFAMEGLEAIGSYERLEASLTSLVASQMVQAGVAEDVASAMGTASIKAQELVKWNEELAINSPFTSEGVAQAFRMAMAYGFTADESKRLTEAMIDFASGTGATEASMQAIARALGQISATGKVTGGDMLQLVNAGLPVTQILADGFGVTTAKIMEMREKGLLPAKESIEMITVYLETNFAGAAERQALTWAGLLATFEDLKQIGLREFFTGLAESIQPLAVAFAEWMQTEGFERLREWGDALGVLTTSVIDKIPQIVESIQPLISIFQNGFAAFNASGFLAGLDVFFASLFDTMAAYIDTWATGSGPDELSDRIVAFIENIGTGGEIDSKALQAMQNVLAALVRAAGRLDWSAIGQAIDTGFAEWSQETGVGLDQWIANAIQGNNESLAALDQWFAEFSIEAGRVIDREFAEWSVEVGTSIKEGIMNGLNQLDINAQKWVDDHIINPIKRALGIASPSTVFADIGRNIVLGLISGLGTMAGVLLTMVEGLVDIILAPLQPILDLLGIGGSTGSTGGIDTSGSGWSDRGGGTGTAGSGTGGTPAGGAVVNNFYGAVYFGDMGQLGYDCPSPHPLMTASSQSLLTSGLE
jgi:tape measure domain-containing protein